MMINKTVTTAALAAVCASLLADEAAQANEPKEGGNPLEQALRPTPDDELSPQASGITDAYVTLAVTPRYPKRALRKEIDGEITLEFEVSRHGRARDIIVVDEEPAGVFDKESIDALKYWAFSPARLAQCGTSVQRVRQTMRFDHDGEPRVQLTPLVVNDVSQIPRALKETTLQDYRRDQVSSAQATRLHDPRSNVPVERVQPEFPIKALERRKEGMVAISFLIDEQGGVTDVEVVDSVAGYLFQRPSLSAIRRWRFEPRVRDGKAVSVPACHEFIFHVDEYQRSGQLARQREDANIRTFSPN